MADLTANAAQEVEGDVAHDDVDAGRPVKIGGYAKAAAPADVSADGDRVAAWFLRNGALVINLASGGTLIAAAALADATANPTAMSFGSEGMVFGGTTWDRARSVEALTAAPNVDTGVPAVGAGPGFDRKTNPTGVSATSTASAVTTIVSGADVIVYNVTTIGTTPGSMIFETTTDDSTWVTASDVLKLGNVPTRIEGAFVPAVGDQYMVRTTGMRQIRYRVNAVYASGTATVEVTGSLGATFIKAIDVSGAPHNIGFALASATAQYTTTQTSTTLGPTVGAGQRMVVTSIQIQAGGTTAGAVQVYFGTGAYSRGTSKAIFDGEFAPSTTLKPGVVMTPSVPWVGAADEELKVTDSAAINPLTVTVWYYLIAA